MDNYIIGKLKQIIYTNNNSYIIGLFRVIDSSPEYINYINTTITFTGNFVELSPNVNYKLIGTFVTHMKYGNQFKCLSCSIIHPTEEQAIIEYLSSPLIKGCGKRNAKRIVDTLGLNCINLIKANKDSLDMVPKMTPKLKNTLYTSLKDNEENDDLIIYLNSIGFNNDDSIILIKLYHNEIKNIIDNNIYELTNILSFNTIDRVYLNLFSKDSIIRIKACILESMSRLNYINGDIYLDYESIYLKLKTDFNYILNEEEYQNIINILIKEKNIVYEDNKYYLSSFYNMENNIVDFISSLKTLNKISNNKIKKLIDNYETVFQIKYNEEQKQSIILSLTNNISIITGGPGTGKTTIIKAIINIYKELYKIDSLYLPNYITLLAPTGRASKRLCELTNFSASTIHRYLEWNKDDNSFKINSENPKHPKLVIIDEVSMVDTFLFSSLLDGITTDTTIILIGDTNQLPSVLPGNTLNDLIESNTIKYTNLTKIYRQKDISYIPYLSLNIKNKIIDDDLFKSTNDYEFIPCPSNKINEILKNTIVELLKTNTINDIQVLAPMYHGKNGIDNLNNIIQELYNNNSLNQTIYGETIFKENDKVIQLKNDIDNNIFNGDIGYISTIKPKELIVNFDNNYVSYKKDDLIKLKLAYTISIHKSQGSEFKNIIIPITNDYGRMLYNKLIYTGITRAKNKLIIIGEPNAFTRSINNTYSYQRKTTLKTKLMYKLPEINNTNNINKE